MTSSNLEPAPSSESLLRRRGDKDMVTDADRLGVRM